MNDLASINCFAMRIFHVGVAQEVYTKKTEVF